VTDADRDRECPACSTAALGEWDDVLRVFVCSTCSATWRRRPGRLVPDVTPRLPGGTVPTMTLSSEWPAPSGAAKGRGC